MLDIDTILDMLDWNNDIETQEKGIEEGKKVRSLEAFIQPYHEKNSKAVWENCAKILSCKNDEELWPHIRALLHWLGDSNWPGYEIILDRLLKFQDLDWLGSVVKECVREAYILNVSVGRFSPFRVGLKTPISVNLKSPMHHVCY